MTSKVVLVILVLVVATGSCFELQTKTCTIDLVLLLDSSGSIGDAPDGWNKVKTFAKTYLDQFEISENGTHVAIVQYAKHTTVINDFNTGHNVQTLKDEIDKMQLGGYVGIGYNTYMATALKKTSDQVFNASGGMRTKDVKKVLVFVTDGKNTELRSPVAAAQNLKDKDVRVITLGVGLNTNHPQLQQIATNKTDYFTADNFNEMTKIAKQMAPDCSKCVSEPVDLVLLLDSSIGKIRWNQLKKFAKAYLEYYDISKNGTHVAIVQYVAKAKAINDFYAGHDAQKLYAEIEKMNKFRGIGQKRHMAKALEYTYDHVFTAKAGEREAIKKVLVFFTGGKDYRRRRENPFAAAKKLKGKGIVVLTLGVGNIDAYQLFMMATTTNSNSYFFCEDNFNDVTAIAKKMVDRQCERYCTSKPVDLVLLLDSSSSIHGEWNTVKNFAKEYLGYYDISKCGTRVAIVQYATKTKVVHNFKFDAEEVKSEIDKLQHDDLGINRDMFKALNYTSHEVFKKSGLRDAKIQKVLVFFTGGKNTGRRSPVAVAKELKDKDIKIITLGVGSNINSTQLLTIATNNYFFRADNFNEMTAIAKKMANGHCERIHICTSEPIDLVLLLDSSASISGNPTAWEALKRFAKIFLGHFDISENGVHVAIVQYAERTKVINDFNAGHNAQKLNAEIENMKIGKDAGLGITTYMVTALDTTSNQVFNSSSGMRNNLIKKVLLFFTDAKNKEFGDPVVAAQNLKNKGIIVYTLGFNKVNYSELKKMATDQTYAFIPTISKDLTKIAKEMGIRHCKTLCTSEPIDLVLLLDSSTNISNQHEWKPLKKLAQEYLKSYHISKRATHVAIVQYATITKVVNDFNAGFNSTKLESEIDKMRSGGHAGIDYIAKALEQTSRLVFNKNSGMRENQFKKILVLFTGGKDNGLDKAVAAAQNLKQKGVFVITVGVGSNIDPTQLEKIATTPKYFFPEDSLIDTTTIAKKIVDRQCEQLMNSHNSTTDST